MEPASSNIPLIRDPRTISLLNEAIGGVPPAPPPRPPRAVRTIRPNDPCPCGKGMKYKRCCGRPDAPLARTLPPPANPHEAALIPSEDVTFDAMTKDQERAYLNALARELESNLPSGPSVNGRASFMLLLPCAGGLRYVTNAKREGAPFFLREAAKRLEAQLKVVPEERGGSAWGRLVGDAVYDALRDLYYAAHAMDNITDMEDPDACRVAYKRALAAAGAVVNAVDVLCVNFGRGGDEPPSSALGGG